jgi:hypothetical protein
LLVDNLVGLKSIGKAGKAVTKQISKTLSAIGESPDQRGLSKINRAQNPKYKLRDNARNLEVKSDATSRLGEEYGT